MPSRHKATPLMPRVNARRILARTPAVFEPDFVVIPCFIGIGKHRGLAFRVKDYRAVVLLGPVHRHLVGDILISSCGHIEIKAED